MAPRFASECEPPIAWSCPECGLFQLESGGRPFRPEEEAAIAALGPVAPAPVRRRAARSPMAAAQAREILETFHVAPPVDVEALAEQLGFPVRWRALPRTQRGGLAGGAGGPVLVLNRNYPFRNDADRRWAVAEELGHAVLGHGALVASDEPGVAQRLREPERSAQEREARAFAAELLMPAAAVRRAFERAQSSILRALGAEERGRAARAVIADLAREFRVSPDAMRIRLRELDLLR
ncbi:MAG TPA: ImmA/IrrE family metallo-endopeptidase [bacterium]|nr:ImmA/IrrE family metallo-endopeptidase [bacterium]